jgi:hypothetical protein
VLLAKRGSQGAPKKKRKKIDVPTYLPFLRFFEIYGFRKYFYGVFGLIMQRNGQKNRWEKTEGKRSLHA